MTQKGKPQTNSAYLYLDLLVAVFSLNPLPKEKKNGNRQTKPKQNKHRTPVFSVLKLFKKSSSIRRRSAAKVPKTSSSNLRSVLKTWPKPNSAFSSRGEQNPLSVFLEKHMIAGRVWTKVLFSTQTWDLWCPSLLTQVACFIVCSLIWSEIYFFIFNHPDSKVYFI